MNIVTTLAEREYLEIQGRQCLISIEPRPPCCDRGNFIAKLTADLSLSIDDCDGWPRYYFSLDAARNECVAWLLKRRQYVGGAEWETKRV